MVGSPLTCPVRGCAGDEEGAATHRAGSGSDVPQRPFPEENAGGGGEFEKH